MKQRLLFTLILVPLLAGPATAGIFFNKKRAPEVKPAERVPQLIIIVKTDGDECRRKCAAEQLRSFDPQQFPDIIPVLIDVLLTDKRASVRAEAAQSLGKLRPVSGQVGQALDHAVEHDPSFRVRLQARSSLMQYHWAGYRRNDKDESIIKGPTTDEPPLANLPPGSTIVPDLGPPQKIGPSPSLPGTYPPPVSTGSLPPAMEELPSRKSRWRDRLPRLSPVAPASRSTITPPTTEEPPRLAPTEGPELGPPPQ